jgi:hypothetical protein
MGNPQGNMPPLGGPQQFNVGLPCTELAPLLPGWRISGCPPGELAAYVD